MYPMLVQSPDRILRSIGGLHDLDWSVGLGSWAA
jgi:hypothetical protein